MPVFQKSLLITLPKHNNGLLSIHTLSTLHTNIVERIIVSQTSHVIWGRSLTVPPTLDPSPSLPHTPSERSPTWALHLKVRHSALKLCICLYLGWICSKFSLFGWIFSLWGDVMCARILACSILYKESSGGSAGQGRCTLPESAPTPPTRAFERPIQITRVMWDIDRPYTVKQTMKLHTSQVTQGSQAQKVTRNG